MNDNPAKPVSTQLTLAAWSKQYPELANRYRVDIAEFRKDGRSDSWIIDVINQNDAASRFGYGEGTPPVITPPKVDDREAKWAALVKRHAADLQIAMTQGGTDSYISSIKAQQEAVEKAKKQQWGIP